jgi:hypothetical protein
MNLKPTRHSRAGLQVVPSLRDWLGCSVRVSVIRKGNRWYNALWGTRHLLEGERWREVRYRDLNPATKPVPKGRNNL